MIESKQKVKDLCDKLMQVRPNQILIDFVQDDIEEAIEDDETTPDQIGALCYECENLLTVYNPTFTADVSYLIAIHEALDAWCSDAEFANRALGIDPNK